MNLLTESQIDDARRLGKLGRMAQTSISFTRPLPEDLFKPGSQNARLYGRLLQGPVTNVEIVRDMCVLNSTGRISDIRKALRPHLMDVKAQPVPGMDGQWLYELRGQ